MDIRTQVIIVGAGPTGLSFALELARYGIDFYIFDKYEKPVATSNALAVHTRTLEIWEDLGILDTAIQRGVKIDGANVFSNDKQIAEIKFDQLSSLYHFILGLAQHCTEEMLLEQLQKKNIKVNMQVELLDMKIDQDTIQVTVKEFDGTQKKITADYLIACDGSHSIVREKYHISFIGKELPQHFVLADVAIESELLHNKLNMFTSPKGILAIIQFDQKYSRIIVDATHDEKFKNAKTLSYEDVKQLLKERCPFSFKISEPIWTSGFWIHERLAETFQKGRVFLAGDAAHIHSPAGGQGMNTGIQDANNLAWKLAFVLQKKLSPAILQTYDRERHAIAKKIVKGTTMLTTAMTVGNRFLQNIRNFMISSAASSPQFVTKMTNVLAQLSTHYPQNILAKECIPHMAGPEAGTRMLDIKMNGQHFSRSISYENLTLLFFMGENDGADIALFYDLKKTLEKKYICLDFILLRVTDQFEDWQGKKIFDKGGEIHHLYGAKEPCFYVIRPDKYIGIRGGLNDLNELKKWLTVIIQNTSQTTLSH